MSCTRMTTSAFLLLVLSPLLVFEFDFLSLLYNMNILRNILTMLGTNVEQDVMTCTRMTALVGWSGGGGDICCCFFRKNFFYFQNVFFFFFFFFFLYPLYVKSAYMN